MVRFRILPKPDFPIIDVGFSFPFCNSGEQLANHISNINLLTTKLGLLCSLEEYQRVQEKMAKNKLVIIT